jgi:drug/metabolite transporter (DMT)-like permease
LLGIVTVVMTLLGWCSVPLFIKHFSHSIDGWTSNGWRYGFSALLWLPVIVWGWRRGTLPAGLWRASVFPAIFNSLGQVAFTWAFYRIDPTTATFGLRLQIVFVAIGAYVLFPVERRMLRNPLAWVSIIMVLAGVAGTIVGGEQRLNLSEAWGVALAIAAGLFFACYGLSVRRCMHGFHPVTAFAAISQYTALVMVALMLGLGADQFGASAGATARHDFGLSALSLGGEQFALLMLSAVIGIALGHVFYYISIARLGVAVSSGVIQLQPFGVAIGSYLFFGQSMSRLQVATGSVAVGGAVLLLWVQLRVSRQARLEETARVGERCPECGCSRAGLGVDSPCPQCGHRRGDVVVAGAAAAMLESGDLDAVPSERVNGP